MTAVDTSFGIQDVFHIGYVVDELERSMTEIASVMDVRWAEVTRRQVPPATANAPSATIGFTYSVEGPVHIELLSAVPGTIWTPSSHEVLGLQSAHHIGMWSEDLAEDREQLLAAGAKRISGTPYFRLSSGLLVEPVARDREPAFQRWFDGASFDG